MKKLLLLLAFVSSTIANSQVWCPPGAAWNYTFAGANTNSSNYGYSEMRYVGDVVINAVNCNKLVRTRYPNSYATNTPLPAETATFITTAANGVVRYQTNAQDFDTLINFNLPPGKGWTMTALRPVACANLTFAVQFTVVDTGHVVVNTFNLKYLKIAQGDSTAAFTNSMNANTIYERMGDINSYMFRYTWGCGDPNDWPFEGKFTCYWDNSFPVYTKAGETCNYNAVGINKNKALNLAEIHPNPSTGIFNLKTELPITVSIYNASGALVKIVELDKDKSTIDMVSAPTGIYFMQYNQNNTPTYLKLIKN